VYCHNCLLPLTNKLHIICDDSTCKPLGVTLCANCFYVGVEFESHANSHAYIVQDESSHPLYTKKWSQREELDLIYAIKRYGLGNWQDVSEHIKTKNRYESEFHYWRYYVDHVSMKEREEAPSATLLHQPQTLVKAEEDLMEDEASADEQDMMLVSSPDPTSRSAQTPSSNQTDPVLPIFDTTTSDQQLMDMLLPELPPVPIKDEIANRSVNKGDINKDDRGLLLHILKRMHVPSVMVRQRDMPLPQRKPQERQNKENDAYVGEELEYLAFRNDFSYDWSNDIEEYIATMVIKQDESDDIKHLKIQLLQVYDHILQERDLRKEFIFERDLLDWEKIQTERKKKRHQLLTKPHIPFSRFVSRETFDMFLQSLYKQQQLRRKIKRLKEYRKNGITTLQETEHYETELKRKQDLKKRKSTRLEERNKPGRKRRKKNEELGAPPKDPSTDPSYSLLTEREQELCHELPMAPTQYIILKDAVLREHMKHGCLKEQVVRVLFPNEDERVVHECLAYFSEAFSVPFVTS